MKKAILFLISVFIFLSTNAQQKEFFTNPSDGKTYKTIKIYNQEWFAEDLKSSTYNDGEPIPNVTNNDQWSVIFSPAYCWFENKESEINNGACYNWFVVNTEKICPVGWHVPNDEDWNNLARYVSYVNVGDPEEDNSLVSLGFAKSYTKDKSRWVNVGKHLKAHTGWKDEGNGSDDYGLSIMPTKTRGKRGEWNEDNYGYYWSSTFANVKMASGWTIMGSTTHLNQTSDDLVFQNWSQQYGFHIRCIKDDYCTKPSKECELLEAVKNNNMPTVKKLIGENANPNFQDENKATILMWAARSDNFEMVKFLCENGANPNTKGMIFTDSIGGSWAGTTIDIAIEEGNFDVVKYLIEEKNVDVNYTGYDHLRNEEGWTPLMWAAYEQPKFVEYLVTKGANIKTVYKKDDYTAIDLAIYKNNTDVVKFLIENGANINHTNKSDGTYLLNSIFRNATDIAFYLINKGVDINLADSEGHMPIHAAAITGNDDLIKLLLQKGANINARDNSNNTPSHFAAGRGHLSTIELLKSLGADLSLINSNNDSPKSLLKELLKN